VIGGFHIGNRANQVRLFVPALKPGAVINTGARTLCGLVLVPETLNSAVSAQSRVGVD
jgi:hypothetical protein